jgi:hypothetical protein
VGDTIEVHYVHSSAQVSPRVLVRDTAGQSFPTNSAIYENHA